MKESVNLKDLKTSNTLVGVYVDASANEVYVNEFFYSVAKQTSKPDVLVLCSDNISDEDFKRIEGIVNNPTIKLLQKDEEGNPKSTEQSAEEKINYKIVKTNASNFPSIFNDIYRAAKHNEYEFFMMAETEDVMAFPWIETANRFASDEDEVGAFLPLLRYIENGVFGKYMNEATWAEGFAEEAGKADINLLNRFNCLNILGALFRVSAVDEYKLEKTETDELMKEVLRLGHYYEFFLRMAYNDIKMLTVPRVGYELRMTSKDYYDEKSIKLPSNITQIPKEKGGFSNEEAKFWMDTSKKEYFFDYVREDKILKNEPKPEPQQ
jgi:hypothetical protein